VFDFTRVKNALKQVVDRLDHRMLLPVRSERIRVEEAGDQVTASYKDKRYVFPRSDVVLLPIPNTTAEMLARWITGELLVSLQTARSWSVTAIEVEVEESFGQRAFYRQEL
jgi:6-pyruvoyltetrahydropterin/6-carboxytetrahydropterin synthase